MKKEKAQFYYFVAIHIVALSIAFLTTGCATQNKSAGLGGAIGAGTGALLGGIAGGFSQILNFSSDRFLGIQALGTIIALIFVVVWGIMLVTQRYKATTFDITKRQLPHFFTRMVELIYSFRSLFPKIFSLSIGILTPLLPCGWLYLFAGIAASTGSPIQGILVMLALWLGSLPWLLSTSSVAKFITSKLAISASQLSGIIVLVFALSSIYMHAKPFFVEQSTHQLLSCHP